MWRVTLVLDSKRTDCGLFTDRDDAMKVARVEMDAAKSRLSGAGCVTPGFLAVTIVKEPVDATL